MIEYHFLDAHNRENLDVFLQEKSKRYLLQGTLEEVKGYCEEYIKKYPTDCAIVVESKRIDIDTSKMTAILSLDANGWYEGSPL